MQKVFTYIFFLNLLSLNAQISFQKIESSSLDETRFIDTYYPENSNNQIESMPLIIVLEGHELFDLVVSNVKFLSKIGYMPKSIVVGIRQEKPNQTFKDCQVDKNTGYLTANSQNFMRFISSEVLPIIAAKYGNPYLKLIIAKNYSANFINHFILDPNPVFSTYISITPEFSVSLSEKIQESVETINRPVNYYVSNSENLTTRQQKSVSSLIEILKNSQNKNLKFISNTFSSPDEFSSPTYSIPIALESIFKVYQPISPKEYREKLMMSNTSLHKYLTEKYRIIFQQLGVQKKYILNDIAAIFEASKRKNDIETIFVLAEVCLKQYPEKMIGHYFNGFGYELMDENKKALKSYEKAYNYQPIDFITKELILSKIESLK